MKEKTAKRNRGYGNGTVYYRASDKRWVGKLKVGMKQNGDPDIRVVYGKSEVECHKKLKDIKDELDKTPHVETNRGLVKDYMQNWLVNVKKNELKPKSYDRLEQTLTLYVYPRIGHIQYQAIKPEDIQNMINDLRDKNYSYSTIKKSYEAVNACFKHGVIQRTVAMNPAAGVSAPAKKLFQKKKIHFYTKEEAKLLIEQSQKRYKNGKRIYPLGSFVPLLINTGLRAGELLALRWKTDIDFENKILTVHNNIAYVKDRSPDAKSKHKILEQDSVKSEAGQDRSIPLNQDALNALLDIHQVTGSNEYVMSTKNGTIVTPRNADRIFRRICIAAGFPDDKVYGLHALRHTFATLLLSNDVDIKTVSELLGHSDVSITYNTYIHVLKEQKAKALQAIPGLISNNNSQDQNT